MSLLKITTFILVSLFISSCSKTKLLSQIKPNKNILVYQGTKGYGVGKHIIFLANDHEYRSEETCVVLARILAKHHGFTCTVLFGIDKKGYISPGSKNTPYLEILKKADLLFIYARFLDLPNAQTKYIVDYLERGGPIIGARTSSHAFNNKKRKSSYPLLNYNYKKKNYKGGFGFNIFGVTWAMGQSHYGRNHRESSLFIANPKEKNHPILRGIPSFHAFSGAYKSTPPKDVTLLMNVSVLSGFGSNHKLKKNKKAVASSWIKTHYKAPSGAIKKQRVAYSSHGASQDLLDANARRWFVNAVFWTLGLEKHITANLDVSLIGKFQPTPYGFKKHIKFVKPSDLADYESPIMPKKKANKKK